MTRHCLIWNHTIGKDIRGEDFADPLPDLIASAYRGRLAVEIINMPTRNPISFEQAISLIGSKMESASQIRNLGYKKGQYHWYIHNFVNVISDLGYHIVLSGEEFEITAGSPKDC